MLSETSYHVWRSMAFKPNDQSYGNIHGIVSSNDLIICTSLHLRLANNIDKGSFYFFCMKKQFSIFLVLKISFFVKNLPNIFCKILPNKFSKILVNTQLTKLLGFKSFYPPLVKKTIFCRFCWKPVKFEL